MKLVLKTILLILLLILLIIFCCFAVYVGYKFFSLLLKFILSGEVPVFHIVIK